MTRRSSEISILLIALLLTVGIANAQFVRTKWSSPASTTSGSVVTDGNSIYSVTDSGQVNSFDRITGENQWSSDTGSTVLVAPVIADGILYVGAADGVYAFDVANGKPVGNLTLNSSVMTPLIASGGDVIAITEGGVVNVIAAGGTLSNSKLIRSIVLPGETVSSTTLSSGKLYIFLIDGTMISVDPSSGSATKLYNNGRPVWKSTPVVVGNMVYIGAGRYFMGITTSGSLNLSKEMNGIVYSPSYGNGVFYIGSDDGNLYAITPNGDTTWAFQTGDAVRTTPIVTNNSIYFGSNDNNIYSISLDGKLKWKSNMSDWPSTPVLINGTLYQVNYDGTVVSTTTIGCAITFPDKNSTVFAQVSLAGEAYADSGINKVEVSTVPGNWQTVDGTDQWSTVLPVSGFPEGNLGIECRVTDDAGNVELVPYTEEFYNYVFSEDELPYFNATLPHNVNVNQQVVVMFTDKNGSPLSNLTVTIGNDKFNVTDPSGKFIYIPQSVGNLTMFVEKPNYQTRTLIVAVTKPLIQPIYIVIIFIIVVAAAIYFSIRRGRWR